MWPLNRFFFLNDLSLRLNARARSRASDFCAFGPVGDSLLCAFTEAGARDRVWNVQAVHREVHQVHRGVEKKRKKGRQMMYIRGYTHKCVYSLHAFI